VLVHLNKIMSLKIKTLLVGGGGGYGGGTSETFFSAGGGGAETIYNSDFTVTATSYAIVVGTGGSSGSSGNPGGTGVSSTFSSLTARGGQGGQLNSTGGNNGAGTYTGGTYHVSSGASGGGAGAGANGVAGTSGKGGNGGIGLAYTITGSSVYYAGGGGGRYPGNDGTNGLGDYGRGGNPSSANGQKGVVIISYVTADFGVCTGGTKTTDGLNTVHTFTSNGNFVVTTVPVVTTQAVTSITATTATGNGNITDTGNLTCTKRGVVYSTTSRSNPGNVSPATSSYEFSSESTGSFSTGAFTQSMTGLISRTTYYVRAYSYNTNGYSYGDEVSFTTIGFTDPANIYASDDTYTTLAATSGVLTVEVSKNAGVNWQPARTVTFTSSDTTQTCGTGSTELWGTSWTRADMVDAKFYVRLSQGNISQVYKTFGFATGSDILTGIEVAIEGKYASSTLSLDHLKVKIYYGTSVLPITSGSQAFASDGRKAGEGAGSGTGVLVFYDGSNWIACDSGTTVAA
jgi:hypothetical protein